MGIENLRRALPRLAVFTGLSLLLAGCFQSASQPLAPTIAVNVTAPALVTFTPAVGQPVGPTVAGGALQSATPNVNVATAELIQSTLPVSNQPTDNGVANLTSAVPANTTDTPFITALPTSGFATPSDGITLLTGTASVNSGTSQLPPQATVMNTPTALPSENPCTYTVRPNDHLIGIAKQLNISLDALMAANPTMAANPNALQIGDILTVPNCGQPSATPAPPTATLTVTAGTPGVQTYTVQSGDSLYVIAQRNNIPLPSLEKANGLTDQSILHVGQVLVIPAK